MGALGYLDFETLNIISGTKLDTPMSIFSPKLAPLFEPHENFPKGSAAEAQSTAIIFGKE